jgi:hypothetical protein
MNRSFGLILLLLALSACHDDPFQAQGTWQPKNLNDTNLREMLANPGDLVAGQSAQGSVGHEAAVAVTRLIQDKQRSLPQQSTSTAVSATAAGGNGNASGGQ